MTISDDLRTTARRTYGVDLVDAELMFAAADRIEKQHNRIHDLIDRVELLEADMDTITGLLAGVETLYTTSEVLARIDLLPSVQAAFERNLGGAS